MHSLLKFHPIISNQIEPDELSTILNSLQEVLSLNTPGQVCEFGCFVGTTSLFLQRLILKLNPQKQLFLYDSFQGLPQKSPQDSSPTGINFKEGELRASKTELKLNFKKANLKPPKVTKAWFKDLAADDLPDQICFAFLDGDFFNSIQDSLNLIKQKIPKGGLILIDDYNESKLPGAKTATDAFLKLNPNFKLKKVENSLAIIKKES